MIKETEFPFIVPFRPKFQELSFVGLKIGIPSKGEMFEGSTNYLKQLGWNSSPFFSLRQLAAKNPENQALALRLRSEDIIGALKNGQLDLGILGSDRILEGQLNGIPLTPLSFLGFGACEFCLSFPLENCPPAPSSFKELVEILKRGCIATSLPKTFSYLMQREGIEIRPEQLKVMTGSVEIASKLFPEVIAVADIVSSGETVMANNLRPDFRLITFPGAFLVSTREKLAQLNLERR